MKWPVAILAMTGMGTLGAFPLVGAAGRVTAQQVKSQWDGIYTDAQATRGEGIYVENCAACHGVDLAGDEFAPALTDAAFVAKWSGRQMGELFDVMRTTMPQTNPGGLSRQQTADLFAFILQKGKSPAGRTELSPQTGELNRIKFLPAKP